MDKTKDIIKEGFDQFYEDMSEVIEHEKKMQKFTYEEFLSLKEKVASIEKQQREDQMYYSSIIREFHEKKMEGSWLCERELEALKKSRDINLGWVQSPKAKKKDEE